MGTCQSAASSGEPAPEGAPGADVDFALHIKREGAATVVLLDLRNKGRHAVTMAAPADLVRTFQSNLVLRTVGDNRRVPMVSADTLDKRMALPHRLLPAGAVEQHVLGELEAMWHLPAPESLSEPLALRLCLSLRMHPQRPKQRATVEFVWPSPPAAAA